MTNPDLRQEELVGHVPALRAFARSLANDASHADDLVQETVLKAWSNLDSYTEGTNMRAWLFTILRNTFYSEFRKFRREAPARTTPMRRKVQANSFPRSDGGGIAIHDRPRGIFGFQFRA